MLFADPTPPGAEAPATVKLDLIGLFTNSPWPVKVTIALLVVASLLVWLITILKYMQVGRMRSLSLRFEQEVRSAPNGAELYAMAQDRRGSSPGARVVRELYARGTTSNLDRLKAIADRAIVGERARARWMLTPLSSIASSSPFIGLFGTVYGIMDAFVRIGAAKNASLPVVAPAIGEALVTTAIGLAAAIPAVIFYNSIEKRVGDFIAELEAAAAEWVTLIAEGSPSGAQPQQHDPRAYAAQPARGYAPQR